MRTTKPELKACQGGVQQEATFILCCWEQAPSLGTPHKNPICQAILSDERDLLPITNQLKLFICLLLFNFHWNHKATLLRHYIYLLLSHAVVAYMTQRISLEDNTNCSPARANEFISNIPTPNMRFRDLLIWLAWICYSYKLHPASTTGISVSVVCSAFAFLSPEAEQVEEESGMTQFAEE